jgi:hypothetical protein
LDRCGAEPACSQRVPVVEEHLGAGGIRQPRQEPTQLPLVCEPRRVRVAAPQEAGQDVM